MILSIMPHEISKAKQITKKFDMQKTHNKLNCNNNFLGYLGEYKFSQLLEIQGIKYDWNNFIKPDCTKTDFEINNHSIDIKTTFDMSLWFQSPEWDYYVLGIIERDLSAINFIGYATNAQMKQCMYEPVIRDTRQDYRIPCDKLEFIDDLFEVLI